MSVFPQKLLPRFIIFFTGLAILPLLLAGAGLYWHSYTDSLETAHKLEQQIALRAAREVEHFFESVADKLETLAHFRHFSSLELAAQEQLVHEVLTKNRHLFREISFYDTQGKERIRLSSLKVYPQQELRTAQRRDSQSATEQADEFYSIPYYSHNGKAHHGPVYQEKNSGEPLMSISIALINPDSGITEGVFAAETRIKQLREAIKRETIEAGRNIFVLGNEGQVLIHENPSFVLTENRFKGISEPVLQNGLHGKKVVSAEFPLSQEHLCCVISQREAAYVFNSMIDDLLVIADLILLALFGAAILTAWASGKIISPIQRLSETIASIQSGKLDNRADIGKQDEIGELAQTFNRMADTLQNRLIALEYEISVRKQEQRELKLEKQELELQLQQSTTELDALRTELQDALKDLQSARQDLTK